jgi:flavin reductase (DIM6/NTAB) family NADH-FMN oxidoreductase RutF
MPTFVSSETSHHDVYFLMTSLVVPRPIAWISTISEAGVCNLAPYSHFNNCSSNPPIVLFSSNGEKDTLRNIRETGEFVVNVVSHDLRSQMRITSAQWDSHVDEIEKAGLEALDSLYVRPPRVRQAKASMECKLREVIEMGSGRVVFGDVLCFHVAEEIWVNGRVSTERLQPVGKLDGSNYATVNEVEHLALPSEVSQEVADFGRAKRDH